MKIQNSKQKISCMISVKLANQSFWRNTFDLRLSWETLKLNKLALKKCSQTINSIIGSIELLFTLAFTYSPAMATGRLANSHKNASVYTHPLGNFVTFFTSTGFPYFLLPQQSCFGIQKSICHFSVDSVWRNEKILHMKDLVSKSNVF